VSLLPDKPIAAHGSSMGTSEDRIGRSRADRRLWTSVRTLRIFSEKFVTMAEGLDCTYEELVWLFRGAVHEATALVEDGEDIKSYQRAERQESAQTGAPISLEHGRRVERPDYGGVIVSPSAGCLVDAE
jgi:hypothetical protein